MNRRALITGASSGIGKELAGVFAKNGWDLVLVSRNAQKLRDLAEELSRAFSISAEAFAADLSKPGEPERLFRELSSRSVHADALVNNAGIGLFGPFWKTPTEAEDELLSLNIDALTKLTRLFLGPMLDRRQGYILNVASTAAFQPGPLMAVYYASKAYVLSFSIALADELRGKGVSVTVLCPGATVTGFQERARMKGSKLFKHHAMDARRVAEEGYRGMMKKKKVTIPGVKNQIMAFSTRLAPRPLAARIARWVQEIDKSPF